MTLECSVSNPLRKQIFHQDYIDLRSFIIIYVIERFLHLKLQTCFVLNETPQCNPKFPKILLKLNEFDTKHSNVIIIIFNIRETPAFGEISFALRGRGAVGANFGRLWRPVGAPPTPILETAALGGDKRKKKKLGQKNKMMRFRRPF